MNDLTTLIVESDDQILVSARELHKQLEVKSNFTTWFNRNSEGFDEGIDFKKCFPKMESGFNGGQNMIDYELTVDTAKQLCMMARCEKGKEIRKYFIQLEKDWNDPNKVMARALKIADRKLAEFGKQIDEMKPKALFADSVTQSKDSILIRELAKILKENGIDTGEKRLYEYLRENGYLIKAAGKDRNRPTQKSIDMGLFEIAERTITAPGKDTKISFTTYVTGKGQVYFINKFLKNN